MKNIFLGFILIITSYTLNAQSLFDFGNGEFVFSGSSYINPDDPSNTQGIANITEIRRADGSLFWDNSDEDLNIVYFDFERTSIAPGVGGSSQFTLSGGVVEFYLNTAGTFNPTGDFGRDSGILTAGDLLLTAEGATDSFGNTATGQFTSATYSSNGFLSVTGGLWAQFFNTNGILDANGDAFADMTFNSSGDMIATAGYQFSGSGDLATTAIAVSAVPLPAAFWMMAPALAGLGFMGRKKSALKA